MDQAEERGGSSSAFGKLLRKHRLAAQFSQEELAERAKMSVDSISALERGVRRWPQRDTIALLAAALGLRDDQRAELAAVGARPRTPRERTAPGRVPTVADSDDEAATLGNLPILLKTLVGRDTEVREIVGLVMQARLVTITGAGGIGKTSSALEAGRTLRDRIDAGAWLIELAALRDPALVVATAARTLAIADSPNRALLDGVVTYLKHKRVLLILDNCEHVIGEAAHFANTVLSGCPGVQILATSREPLRIAGEYVYALSPLDMPPPDCVTERLGAAGAAKFAAIRLFAERAQASDKRFGLTDENAATVVNICRRVDGLPLAIELAAARVTVLPVELLYRKLDHRFEILRGGERTALPRHQTIRALIDWSYDLLTEAERTLFCRLSVFAGGFTAEAACDVCSDERIDAWEVFDVLTSLVAKSLVFVDGTAGQVRYGLLESTSDYARERLAASAEGTELGRKHANYYTARLRDVRSMWEAMDDLGWRHAVLAELDNVRAALEWTLRYGNHPQQGVEILSLIVVPGLIFDHAEAQLWYTLGHDRLDTIADEAVAVAFRSRYATTIARLHAPVAEQVAVCEQNLIAARGLGDPILLADALRELGVALWRAGRLGEADERYSEASAILPPARTALAVRIIIDWANNDIDRGDLVSARTRYERGLEIARPGSQMQAIALMGLAEAEFAVDAFENARNLGRAAMAAFRTLGMKTHAAVVACNLASYEMERDSPPAALELLIEALDAFREVGLRNWLTLVIEKYAVFAALTGENIMAAALLGYVDAQNAVAGRARQADEQRGYDRAVLIAREQLGEQEFEQRKNAGAKLNEEQALELALALAKTGVPAVSLTRNAYRGEASAFMQRGEGG